MTITLSDKEKETYYLAGQHACLDGFPHHSNPYTGQEARQFWSSGWSNPRLPFEKYQEERASL